MLLSLHKNIVLREDFSFSFIWINCWIFREIELREQQTQQTEKNEQQQKRILELTKKVCY